MEPEQHAICNRCSVGYEHPEFIGGAMVHRNHILSTDCS